jgi:hypothetical protein
MLPQHKILQDSFVKSIKLTQVYGTDAEKLENAILACDGNADEILRYCTANNIAPTNNFADTIDADYEKYIASLCRCENLPPTIIALIAKTDLYDVYKDEEFMALQKQALRTQARTALKEKINVWQAEMEDDNDEIEEAIRQAGRRDLKEKIGRWNKSKWGWKLGLAIIGLIGLATFFIARNIKGTTIESPIPVTPKQVDTTLIESELDGLPGEGPQKIDTSKNLNNPNQITDNPKTNYITYIKPNIETISLGKIEIQTVGLGFSSIDKKEMDVKYTNEQTCINAIEKQLRNLNDEDKKLADLDIKKLQGSLNTSTRSDNKLVIHKVINNIKIIELPDGNQFIKLNNVEFYKLKSVNIENEMMIIESDSNYIRQLLKVN